jgi:hypothetical protein
VTELRHGEQIPSNYTGIIKYPNGSKYWVLNGKLHREDGPAIERADGSKYWYLNDKLHREGGPAVEHPNGTKEWWLNNKIYSDANWKVAVEKLKKKVANKPEPQVLELKDGKTVPSKYTGIVKWLDGSKFWYLNGWLHREDGPAVEDPDGTKQWWLNGKRHREDGPAIERADGLKSWWLNDKFHREDGPAIERADGSREWWLNGNNYSEAGWKIAMEKLKKEREEANKPELQVLELKSGEKPPVNYTGIVKWYGTKEWYLNGKLHREDGPAYEGVDGLKSWWLDGLRHREDGPAVERVDGTKAWWLKGKCYSKAEWKIAVEKLKKSEHRVLELMSGEPVKDNFTGIIKWFHGTKEWYLNGKLHREDGPAVEDADGSKEWWLNNQRHRVDGPAIEYAIGTKQWWLNGKRHREDGPAIEWANGSKHWYLNGEPHRVDGPAFERADGLKSWWLNGKSYSETEWNGIVNPVKPELKQKKEEEKPQMSRFKSDMRQAGIRIACRQSVSVVRDTLVSILSAGKTKSEAKRIRDGISSLFDTEVGRGMIGYLMGSMLPMVKEHFPEKYQSITEELANEFRIEGMSVVGGEAFKFVLPFLGMAKEGMVSAMSSLVADDSPPTRVDMPNAAPKVLDDADDMPSVENQKEELKRSK